MSEGFQPFIYQSSVIRLSPGQDHSEQIQMRREYHFICIAGAIHFFEDEIEGESTLRVKVGANLNAAEFFSLEPVPYQLLFGPLNNPAKWPVPKKFKSSGPWSPNFIQLDFKCDPDIGTAFQIYLLGNNEWNGEKTSA